MKKERRKEIRVDLISEHCVWSNRDIPQQSTNLINISKSGAFLESNSLPKIGDVVCIKLLLPSDLGILEIPGKVKWRRWASIKSKQLPIGFGIEFMFDYIKTEKILEAYCTYLRNKQIIKVSQRIIDAFFADKPMPIL